MAKLLAPLACCSSTSKCGPSKTREAACCRIANDLGEKSRRSPHVAAGTRRRKGIPYETDGHVRRGVT